MNVPAEVDRRFRDAAAALDLIDVGYDVLDSPVGPLLVAASDRGIVRISYEPDPEEYLEHLARLVGPRVLRTPRPIEPARRQLDEYFEGRRHAFELDVDVRIAAPFAERVLHELAFVPYGTTTTYGMLAARAGKPRAARAVGTVMNRNPIPIVLPCHRVIGADGSLVGYGGGLSRKEQLLRLEGALL